ncbi:MAG TPA: hypothetical protein VNX40_04880 [Mucilaginibacter sp.]|jgi:hypothetical protein|nr:hypothetical protein [Mucilaginibacter sp.]
MMYSLLRYFAITSILFLFSLNLANAQVDGLSKNSLEQIKEGHTHVIVGDLNFSQADRYLEVFKKYWTLTKGIDFIKAADLQNNMIAGDSYFNISTFTYTGSEGQYSVSNYMDLWIPKEKALKKAKDFSIYDENILLRAHLSADLGTMLLVHGASLSMKKNPDFGIDFDGGGHFYNWGPGMLKNYLQQISAQLQNGKKISYDDELEVKSQLQNLKADTLFCAQNNLIKMSRKDDKNFDPADIFKDYEFKYKVVSDKEIQEKIVSSNRSFYYLILFRTTNSKTIYVINASSGEIVYARHHGMASENLKSGDLEDLDHVVRKL